MANDQSMVARPPISTPVQLSGPYVEYRKTKQPSKMVKPKTRRGYGHKYKRRIMIKVPVNFKLLDQIHLDLIKKNKAFSVS